MSDDKPNSLKSVALSDAQSDRNLSDNKEILIPSSNETYYLCFCVSDKWCFKHQGISAYKNYDKNDCLCCTYLDCCSWCLEFKQKKNSLCKYKTICFFCCFSITFD